MSLSHKKLLIAALCTCTVLLPSCRTAAFNAAIEGDAVAMQRLANEGACLSEKNAMNVPKNPLYKLLVQIPLGLTALAWDIGTLGNFFTGASLTERIIGKKTGDLDDTPINAASLRGHDQVVRILLRAGERPDNFTIHKVARENHAAVLYQFMEYNLAGANWVYDGWPLLMWSARDNAPDVTRMLIARGAFVNYSDDKGRTPLFLAAWNENVDDARALIAAGANINSVLTKADNYADPDKCITIVRTLQLAGAPKAAFASHYLYGRNTSTLAIAITRAGAPVIQPTPEPIPTPIIATPKKPQDSKMNKEKKKKVAPKAAPKPAPAPAPSPAPKPQKPSRSTILQDFS